MLHGLSGSEVIPFSRPSTFERLQYGRTQQRQIHARHLQLNEDQHKRCVNFEFWCWRLNNSQVWFLQGQRRKRQTLTWRDSNFPKKFTQSLRLLFRKNWPWRGEDCWGKRSLNFVYLPYWLMSCHSTLVMHTVLKYWVSEFASKNGKNEEFWVMDNLVHENTVCIRLNSF